MEYPDLQMGGGGGGGGGGGVTPPRGEGGGGGGGGGHPDPEIRWGGFFRPFGPQFGLRIRGWGDGPPGPLPWIPHWHVLNKNENIINAGYWVLPKHRKK